jgi:hypothetical protein
VINLQKTEIFNMGIFLIAHSHFRWLVLALAIVAGLKFLYGWVSAAKFQKVDRILAAAFAGAMDLQALMGLIVILWLGFTDGGGGFPRQRLEHGFAMLIAVVVAHLPARWKNAPDSIRFRNTALCIIGSFVIVFLGVAALPGGWTR